MRMNTYRGRGERSAIIPYTTPSSSLRADMEAADLRARQRHFAAGLAATAEKAWGEHDRRQRGRQDYYQRGGNS